MEHPHIAADEAPPPRRSDRSGGQVDLDAVTDELYGLSPDDFTAAREQRAQQARQEGARELAEEIHRLRRPTLAAWSANLLAREQPEQARLLLGLGEALRQAHRDLDGAQLRELSARQHQVTARLAQEAAELAAQYGHRISETARREVTDTLHAALADPQAGRDWAAGRLDRPRAAPVGFTPGETEAGGAGGEPSGRASSKSDRSRDRGRNAGRKAGRDTARRREQLTRARERAREAERALETREGEHRAAREAADQAAERQEQAEQRLTGLRERLREAEGAQQRARSEVRTAQDRLRRAERSEEKARRKADDARGRADQLADGP
ncbi:hypothetical protein DTL70_18060 [Streptomyces diacarni]|uniref:Uncharacterized protein n=1 Tax=Streptomyces diacarni TaxID=2800381 RepID=A0A367EVD2_9ACTN|nr:hypothetical protein [Streptomyces diacarni]RCG21347.1 hypothetical protein DTL70_18060 [Streptomyces diacarni]